MNMVTLSTGSYDAASADGLYLQCCSQLLVTTAMFRQHDADLSNCDKNSKAHSKNKNN